MVNNHLPVFRMFDLLSSVLESIFDFILIFIYVVL